MRGLKLQLFIHRYYDTIKLTILILLVFMTGYLIVWQVTTRGEQIENRTAAVAEVVKANKEENDRQTEIINRQFRALCILIVDVSGSEGLSKLDPETRQRCEELATPESQSTSEGTTAPRQSPAQPNQTSSSPSSNGIPQNGAGQPDNSQPADDSKEGPTNLLPLVEMCVTPIRLLGGCL